MKTYKELMKYVEKYLPSYNGGKPNVLGWPIQCPNDKEFISNHYLPNLWGKLLYVGCLGRGMDEENMKKTNANMETVDIAVGKNPTHLCDFTYEFKNEYKYDHISLHGLWYGDRIGWDGKEQEQPKTKYEYSKIIIDSISKAHSILKVGGTLQIGPNTNMVIPIYDYLLESGLYNILWRRNREQGRMANCIFWGQKKSSEEFNFEVIDLWKK